MNETSKAHPVRERHGDYETYLRGDGLDIGCGPDPLKSPFAKVTTWDIYDGNALYLGTVEDRSYDFVYSSHCLEHMTDVPLALRNWSRVTKIGGFVFVIVPEWTLYEHRQWPSVHNPDHKASFAIISAPYPENHPHYTVETMITFGGRAGLQLLEARIEMDGFDWSKHTETRPFLDQTMGTALAQAVFIYQRIK